MLIDFIIHFRIHAHRRFVFVMCGIHKSCLYRLEIELLLYNTMKIFWRLCRFMVFFYSRSICSLKKETICPNSNRRWMWIPQKTFLSPKRYALKCLSKGFQKSNAELFALQTKISARMSRRLFPRGKRNRWAYTNADRSR